MRFGTEGGIEVVETRDDMAQAEAHVACSLESQNACRRRCIPKHALRLQLQLQLRHKPASPPPLDRPSSPPARPNTFADYILESAESGNVDEPAVEHAQAPAKTESGPKLPPTQKHKNRTPEEIAADREAIEAGKKLKNKQRIQRLVAQEVARKERERKAVDKDRKAAEKARRVAEKKLHAAEKAESEELSTLQVIRRRGVGVAIAGQDAEVRAGTRIGIELNPGFVAWSTYLKAHIDQKEEYDLIKDLTYEQILRRWKAVTSDLKYVHDRNANNGEEGFLVLVDARSMSLTIYNSYGEVQEKNAAVMVPGGAKGPSSLDDVNLADHCNARNKQDEYFYAGYDEAYQLTERPR
ncbi:hypothetical protein BDK51DRAFT_27521 [Blyttiomyces helicus]|uniref:Uncharacterized protein n=1 Tax=Blyttiomyces helicus TaxID=388810 RepID=A0A4P9WJH3_9FUNG|nr:hypothetical protein BDK51DRAFT_27521 [Blyttiomyces helicus]|eukprot:RKO93071.1 hypothetical protein BDK51DRAFT_27521 [Blyttiomyces helicus]